MLARAISCAVRGISGVPVAVEADVANGLPNFTIVGLTDRAIQEARQRVRAAVDNSGFDFPKHRLTVNLAPAELPKEGTCFDLGIAVAVLRTYRSDLEMASTAFIAELALDGSTRPVAGVLPMARGLAAAGVRRVMVAQENGGEAAQVEGLEVIPVTSLAGCVAMLLGAAPLPHAQPTPPRDDAVPPIDLGAIRGQAAAKRALEIAATGGHNVLMVGPPGSGKTMLAHAFAGLLPDLDADAALEVATIWSLRGRFNDRPASLRPPFRSPHHSVSRAGLIGGGSRLAQPGEISLAHHGTLFVDELCEFPRGHLEALRQPIEDGTVTIARARGAVTFPATFALIAATNPCPCGYHGDPARSCECNPAQLAGYRSRLSGPMRDRIDLHVEVPRPEGQVLLSRAVGTTSEQVSARVGIARNRQRARAGDGPFRLNAQLDGDALVDACAPTPAALGLLTRAAGQLALSARAVFRILRVARSIADLDGADVVGEAAIAEALRYRVEAAG